MQANVDLSLEDLIRQQKAAAAKPAAPKPATKPPVKAAKTTGYKGKSTFTNGPSPKPAPGSGGGARPSTPTVDLRRTLKTSGSRVSGSGKPDDKKAVDLRQTLSASTRPAIAAQGKVASAVTDDLRSVLASRKSGPHHHSPATHAAPAQKQQHQQHQQHQQQKKQWPKQGPGMTKIQVVVGPNGRREVRQATEPVKISIVNDRVATPEPARPVPNAVPTVVQRPTPLSLSFVPAPQPPAQQPAITPAPPAQQRPGLIVISGPPGYSNYQPPMPHQPYRPIHAPLPHGMPHTMVPPTMAYHSTGVPGYPGHFAAPPVAAPPVPALAPAPAPLVSQPTITTPAPGLGGITVHTIRMGNLHPKTTADELRRHLSDFGEIIDVQLLSSPEGKPLGIALISYTSEAACSAAIRQFNNVSVDGFTLKVDYHKPTALSSSAMARNPLPLAPQAHPTYR
ncbi:hypothetical protein AMAG_09770 [Allomyces macrogynus ATCC 38327]|uniref:RRM domain-containing protein n=1 Tax=Allomyces macrogynus (strain ATCC 38327) TaxID=578462 RepID=A0A0L0STY4_ALLM3|nr:hypothetical protein AMAG_09770 [Allomyces macrogynus ATCC 38327]|eukprot:KNE65794.1 hypothetical protein AMAG_09770 [Allomyces macrogynus ATCC 38327]